MENVKVLYEDNHIIAVFKPAGILSQPDKTKNESMFDEVKTYLKTKYQKPGAVFLGLVHRLDRPACGILLFAKTSKGASRLSEQFRNKTIEKTYQVIVGGVPKSPRGVLKNLLGKDEKLKKAREFKDGAEANLNYEVIKILYNPTSLKLRGVNKACYTLLKIKIDAGKFHQIRAQLSLAGMPIVGDVKYKGERWADERAIALCATNISFKMATEDRVINLAMDIPKEWQDLLAN